MKRMPSTQKIGDASISYLTKGGLALEGTPYGQMAKTLDQTGLLAMVGKKRAYIEAIESFDD